MITLNPDPTPYKICSSCASPDDVRMINVVNLKVEWIINVPLCLDCLHKLYVVLGENKEVNP